MKQSWEDKLELTVSAAPEEPTVQDGAFETEQAIEAARLSLDFLAALALPTVFKYFFPDIFKSIWAWLCSKVQLKRDFSQLAIGLPRGFAKTMVIKLFVLYCILFTTKKFILVIAGTQGKANNIISDICGMLDEPNIKKLFGDWTIGAVTDRLDLKRFGFRGRNIILMGAGSGSDIRGITLENARPDVMIFDDIQTRDEADSEQVSTNLETWLYGTAMKAKSPEGCLFVFIANMYPTQWSLLRRIKNNPTWDKYIVGGILANGTSLWEALQPIRQLLKEFQRDLAAGKEAVFYAEVLNDENASVNNLVDLSRIPPYPFAEGEIPAGKFVIIDPSNDKANSDLVAIAYFEVLNGVPVCMEAIEERLSPGDIIRKALTMALNNNCRVIGIESNAFQYSLHYWFAHICEQVGIIGIETVELYSGVLSKPTRILTMFKELVAGELVLHPKVKPLIHTQINSYNPLKPREQKDNLLDCLTYAKKMIVDFGHLIAAFDILTLQEHEKLSVHSAQVTSCF